MRKTIIATVCAAVAIGGAIAMAPLSNAESTSKASSSDVTTASVRAPYRLVDSCRGTKIREWQLRNSFGDKAGILRLYYSSSYGGTNCVILYDNAPGSHVMSVGLRRSDLSYYGVDSGNYQYYAGGVEIRHADNRCVYVKGKLSLGSHSIDQYRGSWGPVACG